LKEPPHGDTFMRLLVMVFDGNGLNSSHANSPISAKKHDFC